MVPFIPAAELQSRFDVYGHFYTVKVTPKITVECRSVLEIVEQSHAPKKSAAISKAKPDAIFVMMNPGSSRAAHRSQQPHPRRFDSRVANLVGSDKAGHDAVSGDAADALLRMAARQGVKSVRPSLLQER